ncbi:YfdX family protein [Sorangium sp. So ce388]|uniref:YfdX family protein n=1 Tax=Sorangium sp. So ce388 TaxID=3133309 RepID=UPI003F5B6821
MEQTQIEIAKQRKGTEQQARPKIEKHRNEAQQQAERTLDSDAIAAVEQTRGALDAIAEDKPDEAIAAIERATGKISVLLARNPATALVPVEEEVEVIDGAPEDLETIEELEEVLERMVKDKNYPTARVMLLGLTSEILVRTYNLPLATYPAALQDAARLLDQKKTEEARAVLETALDTLVVIDRVIPLPLVLAETAIDQAQALRDKDRDQAMRLVTTARHELDRAKALGYSGDDPEYEALNKAISDLETQLRGKEDTTTAFARLKDKVKSFLKRQSESERH